MKKQSNTPQIRFHNYKELWECDRLKNIFRTIRNAFVGTATPYYVEKGHFYLESNNVKNGKINYNSQIFINDEFYEKQRDKWLKTNDIVMVQSGHVGHTAVIPKELNNTAAHALIVFTDYKKEVNPHFLNYQFQSSSKRKEINLISTGNTIKHILASEMKSFKMDFPTVEEQSAIGSLFRTLDDLLTSYKDNLANYQSLKAAMLSKMFPKAGQTVPEIRLDGFEGEWEEKEFIQIVNRVTESSDSDSLPKVEFEDIISGQGKLNKDISSKFDNRKGILFKPGYTLYGKLRPYLNNWLLPKFEGVALGDFWVFDPNGNNSDFIYYLVQSSRYQKVANDTSGTKMPRSDWKSVSTTIFAIPQTIAEQQAIGAYFSNLDNLINSHQEKISQLGTLKKKLLQNMFI
ncbi:restriction endonuclease subunit S [Streptococcus vestibularis]|uniref:restriction endonuclease subunit S n=1 Tax=Streptococcus vestibularis TaxID=1343 RepID=UPI0026EE3952|nr:restriction endonuclease subunit S [Streptococcus vestibularis]